MLQQPLGDSTLVVQTVQEAVVERLRHLILSGQLRPGQRLVQDELASRLGVSRTPIREALQNLAHEGLVTLSSYKGASVAPFSLADLTEVYTIRCALESHATYLAAQRIGEQDLAGLADLLQAMALAFQRKDLDRLLQAHGQFHASIYAAAGSPRLCELTLKYLGLADVYQRMALSLGRGAKDPVVEHQDLLCTLQQHDAEAAGRLMRSHLEATASELLELFGQHGDPKATPRQEQTGNAAPGCPERGS